jgi:hypothetical protein
LKKESRQREENERFISEKSRVAELNERKFREKKEKEQAELQERISNKNQ